MDAVEAVANDTLQTIAQRLVNAINAGEGANAARYNQYLDLYVVYIDPVTGLPVEDTIQRRGELAVGYQETGLQLRGYAMVNGSNQQLYEDALGNQTTDVTDKRLFIIDQDGASCAPLFIDGLGRLTTEDTGLQALLIV